MKRTVIGIFLALLGSIWAFVILFIASSNIVNQWYTDYGKLFSVVLDFKQMFPFVLSAIVTVSGLVLLLVEYFRREK